MSKATFQIECAVRDNIGGFGADFLNCFVRVKDNGDGTFTVTLDGHVSAPGQKRQAQKAAEATEGVIKVINNLQESIG
jgi:hypothetical protein